MFVVGVTGGIGSGKTAATDRFAALGITIVDADVAARIVVEPGAPALKQITTHFGSLILLSDGSLNRAELRKIIFADVAEKAWLEQLLHPLIATEIQHQLQSAKSPYVIFVSPLMTESSQHELCDRVLVIDAPEETQLQRTMQRDNNDAAQVQRIISSQANRQHRLQHADDVIENTGSLESLTQQVKILHTRYLQLAQEKLRGEPQPARQQMSDTKEALLVKCPTCHAEAIWSKTNPHRPFCSERCRNKDFIEWANEEQRIGGDTDYDDLLSEDLGRQ